ncbi:hypothetical protein [Peribacillus simplex]|nr:hypothetical protein [Peribacillus simplex]
MKMLRNYFHKEYYDVPDPLLDEQQLEEINS